MISTLITMWIVGYLFTVFMLARAANYAPCHINQSIVALLVTAPISWPIVWILFAIHRWLKK